MTVEVPILQISKFVEAKLDKFARVLVFEADEAIKTSSPVDLGRFRASWMVGQNDTSGQPKPFKAGGHQMPKKPQGSNYIPGKEKIGNTYSIHNNLPYAEKLCFASGGSGLEKQQRYNPNRFVDNWAKPGDGGSHQIPEGWFELIGKNLEGRANELWNHISKED